MSSSTNEKPSETPGRLVVGHIARAHGIRGDAGAKFYSDDPHRFSAGDEFVTEPGGQTLTISAVKSASGGHIVTFSGIETRNEAEALRGQKLTIAMSARRTLDEDEYWPEDLVGLEARSPDGSPLGTVVEVVIGDAQDRLGIQATTGSRVDVPFVEELVPVVDHENGFVVVVPLPGLFSEHVDPPA